MQAEESKLSAKTGGEDQTPDASAVTRDSCVTGAGAGAAVLSAAKSPSTPNSASSSLSSSAAAQSTPNLHKSDNSNLAKSDHTGGGGSVGAACGIDAQDHLEVGDGRGDDRRSAESASSSTTTTSQHHDGKGEEGSITPLVASSKPPLQVTFDGTISEERTESTETTPLDTPNFPSSPSQATASSEEDSVAEMNYMTRGEGSVLVNAAAEPENNKADTTGGGGTNSAGDFVPKRLMGASSPLRSPSSFRTISTGVSGDPVVRRKVVIGGSSTIGEISSSAPAVHRQGSSLTTIRGKTSPSMQTVKTGTLDVDSSKPEAGSGATSCAPVADGVAGGGVGVGVRVDLPATSTAEEHRPLSLPIFRETSCCMWTASHAANCPTEDRSASLVNLLLQPLPPNFDSETQLPPLEPDYKTLIRLNLWGVIDGHGGGSVATYASEVLLPHIAASVSRALGCAIVDRGVCTVNGQLRDANALDLDGLIRTSDRSLGNPNSIHYRSPYERSDSEDEEGGVGIEEGGVAVTESALEAVHPRTPVERKQIASLVVGRGSGSATVASGRTPSSVRSIMRRESAAVRRAAAVAAAAAASAATSNDASADPDASVSSVKTSVKTAASPANREAALGTHSPREVAAITRAITESFLAVDEGWINSIDPVVTHQTSCQSNGRWNSGACALVVFTIQRLDWTSVSEPDREKELPGPEESRRNTSQNRDAARRRMLDYAARTKSASSISTVSSTSSLTTEETVNASGLESEITETEGEDDRSFDADARKRNPTRFPTGATRRKEESLISPPGGCSCHCYRAYDAILYTAHVGDCRAVMLGSAPPRTIKVRDSSHPDTTDDESSHHSSDETECLSSSDHDADSSEEEDPEPERKSASASTTSASTASSMFPKRLTRQKVSQRRSIADASGPYIALPPLVKSETRTPDFHFETDISRRDGQKKSISKSSDSSTSSNDSDDLLPLVILPPATRPIDLTTDHSAYNPAEVTAVLRRCNNAPRAISAGVGGGIKRVAGSLAVTRALGDAYLKTPQLSFLPYKSHAPYITARPEVNCRPLVKDGDKVLILATDGVWERAGGEDVLRWVRNFYQERIAEAERRNNRRSNQNQPDKSSSSEDPDSMVGKNIFQQEASDRDLFERQDLADIPIAAAATSGNNSGGNSRKREREPPTRGGGCDPLSSGRQRKRSRHNRISYNVADVIVRRVLNKVRRARNISSLQTLMSLPPGRARRSKHDDITASVVDLSAFVS